MLLLNIFDTTLPLTNPVLKFLVILVIILFAPIILNKLKIPHLLGLIIAGAVVGPNALNLLERDSSIVLSGTAGLLYIMFLAGLEIDLIDFKKNSKKSLVFGLFTFTIPMVLGVLSGLYLLDLSVQSAVLLASMFASHTLIAYPLISKLGIAKNRAVNVTVGGTMITDTLALLVLAVIVGMTTGEVNTEFWVRLCVSIIIFGVVIIFGFPILSRWFFKNFDDSVSQYIFVLLMVYLGAVLAELAGIEGIIGAFLTGLSLNRLIPHTSPLMNRVEFVGNAIFIPFFLIGVGMLIDYRAFFKDVETIKVGAVMIVVATVAKFLAAWATQKTFGYTVDERRVIFGLSNAQAAATLAAVLVGYNIVLGETADGEPIRLLSESILNGTILMILVTCTIATFQAQKGAKMIALYETNDDTGEATEVQERILIPIINIDAASELVNLGMTIKSKNNKSGMYALNVIDSSANNDAAHKKAQKILDKAVVKGAAADTQITPLLRYDINVINGITNAVKENEISDLIMGLHVQKDITDSFLGNLTEGVLEKCPVTTLIYKSTQPFATIKRHLIIIPENAEREMGFPFWIIKLWNIARNSGAKLVFFGHPKTLEFLKDVQTKHSIDSEFREFAEWDDFLIFAREVQKDDNMIIVMSRKGQVSYQDNMAKIPAYLNKYFRNNSFILIYPLQFGIDGDSQIDLKNASIIEPIEKLDEIRRTITKMLRRK